MMRNQPRYLKLKQSGQLRNKIDLAWELTSSCVLCPRECRVQRDQHETGFCATGEKAVIASYAPHFGEEPPLSGSRGSGTIFFGHCNLKCCFCQNWDISVMGDGIPAEHRQISAVMLELQQRGCHNINLVTPSHVIPQILQALDAAIDHGLNIPIVYNSSGYDRIETLKLLDGVVDIYLPDIKFLDNEIARQFCDAPDYPGVVKSAVKEMYRQVGRLVTDEDGIATSGLLVRHLIMPDNLSTTDQVMRFLSREVTAGTHVNVMGQYHPAGTAARFKALSRMTTPQEYRAGVKLAEKYGLTLVR